MSVPSTKVQLFPQPCRRSFATALAALAPRFVSIHVDIAELALASSGMMRSFPCAIFLAYSNWAALTGLWCPRSRMLRANVR